MHALHITYKVPNNYRILNFIGGAGANPHDLALESAISAVPI